MARGDNGDVPFYTEFSDEIYEELAELAGQRIAHVTLWQDSLLDELSEGQDVVPILYDLDVYLEDGVYFELYGTACHPDPDADPLEGLSAVEQYLLPRIDRRLYLLELAADHEDRIVLVLGQATQPELYLVAAGWLLEEWEELPPTP